MLRSFAFGLCALGATLAACGDDGSDSDVTPDAVVSDAPPPACAIEVRQAAPEPSVHVQQGQPLVWDSNPPSIGRHYPIWALWDRNYTEVVPRGYWVHNLEHGGVVLLYNCPDGCDEDVAALAALTAALPVDPICSAPRRTRTLITADPELPAGVRIAAASWGWTYTAPCFDAPSLNAFIADHYANSPEDTCSEGSFQP